MKFIIFITNIAVVLLYVLVSGGVRLMLDAKGDVFFPIIILYFIVRYKIKRHRKLLIFDGACMILLIILFYIFHTESLAFVEKVIAIQVENFN